MQSSRLGPSNAVPLEGPDGVRVVRLPLSGETILERRHPSVESEESLGYHCGSWLGDGIQPRDGLTDGEDDKSLEFSLLVSLDSADSSPK